MSDKKKELEEQLDALWQEYNEHREEMSLLEHDIDEIEKELEGLKDGEEKT